MHRRTSAPPARIRMAGSLAAALALVSAPSALGCSSDRLGDRDLRPLDVATTTRHEGPKDVPVGLVAPGTGHARPRRAPRARGHSPGPVDAPVGPRTCAAVTRLGIGDALTRTVATVAARRSSAQHARPTATPTTGAADDIRHREPLLPPASAARTRIEAMLIVGGLVLAVAAAVIITRSRSADETAPPPQPDDTRSRLAGMASPARQAVGARRATRVLGYAIARPGEPPPTRLDLATDAIARWCESRGLPLDRIVHDVEPRVRTSADRPGLYYALNQIREGAAAGLVCAHLGDLSRSLPELGAVLRWFLEADAIMVALDVGIDTSTASGATAARMLAQIGHWERARLTKDSQRALAAGASRPAVRNDPELSAWIREMRARGMSLQAIADALNAEGVPTKRGGARWRPSSVQTAAGYKRPPARLGGIDLPPLPLEPTTDPDRDDTRA
jgi:DNA invertase Pin-like site-specific DNA recombinase